MNVPLVSTYSIHVPIPRPSKLIHNKIDCKMAHLLISSMASSVSAFKSLPLLYCPRQYSSNCQSTKEEIPSGVNTILKFKDSICEGECGSIHTKAAGEAKGKFSMP
jgi:hypothetical protein